ncbi:MAG: hypothetical protein DMG53_20860, partial [Acidobacteria bacterium]
MPAWQKVQLHVAPEFPYEIVASENRTDARVLYRWKYTAQSNSDAALETMEAEPDIVLTTFKSWQGLSLSLGRALLAAENPPAEVAKRAAELTLAAKTRGEKIEAIYDFVSQKVSTIDLPLGSTGFHGRPANEILSSGYATAEDKFNLFTTLCRSAGLVAIGGLGGAPKPTEKQYPRPSPFTHLLVAAVDHQQTIWLDPTLDVAPFQAIPSNLRGVEVLYLHPPWEATPTDIFLTTWLPVPGESPIPAKQFVSVDATLAARGNLTAKVHYSMRGD